jgi:predicted O-methyltransferase YrrM
MKFNEVVKIVGNVPHMTKVQGKAIYKMVLESSIKNILELGFAHGTSTCYMAAALEEKKEGKIITIDKLSAKQRNPNIYQLIASTGFSDYIEPIFGFGSYNWELMRIIEKQTKNGICKPIFDFCFLDGSHNFEIDCCAFFLLDKLLNPGAYILLDDLLWTYNHVKDTELVKRMSIDELTTPHIKKLFDLIITQHQDYTDFSIDQGWAMARKKLNTIIHNEASVKLKDLYSETSIYTDLKKIARKLRSKILM